MTGSPRRWLVAVVAALTVVGLGGCASSEQDRARTAADDFVNAVHDGDGGAACAMLAPATVEELEQSSGSACADAVLEDAVEAGTAGEHQPFRVDVAGQLRRTTWCSSPSSTTAGGWSRRAVRRTAAGPTTARSKDAEMRLAFLTYLLVVLAGVGYVIALGLRHA